MPISRFGPGGSQFDVTPLENLYIENYMANAPGEFVKVYVYALMLCYRPEEHALGTADLAQALHMNEDAVRAAFAYWEQLGLVKIASQQPLEVEYLNLKLKFINGSAAKEPEKDKIFGELVQHVQGIFTGERVLITAEYNRINDWYTVLSFEPEAIALMIQYCVGKKGPKVSFNYIDAMAQDLARKNMTTSEDMEAHMSALEAVNSGAGRIIIRWSLKRLPTADEMALYRKWTEGWGFTEEAVNAACAEMTGVANPNFKYLDSIVESLHERGAHTARLVAEAIDDRKKLKDTTQGIAKALGMRETSSNATELLRLYEFFTSEEIGFSEWSIMLAARMLSMEGRSTLADLAARLNKWLEDGTVTDEALMLRNERDGEAGKAVRRWLDLWGQQRAPTAGELSAHTRFTREWGMDVDLVNFAAERSAVADRPLAMMNRLLTLWKEKNIRDRAGAEAEQARGKQGGGAEDFADRNFTNQNAYTKEDFDKMKTGLFNLKDI